jgi:hypothetical protein
MGKYNWEDGGSGQPREKAKHYLKNNQCKNGW